MSVCAARSFYRPQIILGVQTFVPPVMCKHYGGHGAAKICVPRPCHSLAFRTRDKQTRDELAFPEAPA